MSDKALQSVQQENRLFPPPEGFARQAFPDAAALQRLREQANRDPQAFWAAQASAELQWQHPFTQVLDDSAAPNYRWFIGGRLNVSYNCLDVHLKTRRDATALVFEAEGGEVRRISYGELHAEVCRFANA